MQFDKPKVTIDFEEYQYLKDRIKGVDSDEMIIAAKEVISALLFKHPGVSYVGDHLMKKGIRFYVAPSTHWQFGDVISANDIHIEKIKPNER